MLIDAVAMVLRETLEASVLIGLLSSMASRRNIPLSWLNPAIILGLIAGGIYALSFNLISTWFEHIGQEIVNATLQCLIYVCGLVIIMLFLEDKARFWQARFFLILILALTLSRESCEIFIFYYAYIQTHNSTLTILTSGFVGLAIGCSVGILIYYLFLSCKPLQRLKLDVLTLSLIISGMLLQATQLMIQIDWLNSGNPIWDLTQTLPETSIASQFLYAVFGFEAKPTAIEMIVYFNGLVFIYVMVGFKVYLKYKKTLVLISTKEKKL